MWFPKLYSRMSLVIYFTHSTNSIYVSIPISQSTPLPTFPPWSSYICSLCPCLYFCFINKGIRLIPYESDDRCGTHTIKIMKGAALPEISPPYCLQSHPESSTGSSERLWAPVSNHSESTLRLCGLHSLQPWGNNLSLSASISTQTKSRKTKVSTT